jgi:hypothetical protein
MKLNRFRTKLGTALIVIGSASALAACGGGDTSDSDFTTQANAACTTNAKVYADIDQSPNGLLLNQEQAVAVTAAKSIADRVLASDLQGLDAPTDVKPAYDDFVALAQQLSDTRAAMLSDFRANDQATAATDSEKYLSLVADYVKAADAAGLSVCAGDLPADQVAALTGTIETNETTVDPAKCTEYLTANGVKTAFVSMAFCRQAQQKPSNAATSVDVTKVAGSDGVSATAQVAFHGGPSDGQTATYEFVYVDGKWKVDYFAPTAS